MSEKPSDDNMEKGNPPVSIENSTDDALPATKLNNDAFKSDESDGKITWTFTHRVAAFSLCLLYVGMSSCSVKCLQINII